MTNTKRKEDIEMTDETRTVEKPTYEELEARIVELEEKLERVSAASGGRKAEVLKYLQENGHCRVSDIAKALGISDRNVSSQMTYLRKDGVAIATDSRGLKFIETPEEETA